MKAIHFKIDGRKKRRLKNDKKSKNMTWQEYFTHLQKMNEHRYNRKQKALKALKKRYDKGKLDFSSYVLIKNRINRI